MDNISLKNSFMIIYSGGHLMLYLLKPPEGRIITQCKEVLVSIEDE
jgi:hypothetical protein